MTFLTLQSIGKSYDGVAALESIDLTVPAPGIRPGALHPITQIQWEIEDLFRYLAGHRDHAPIIDHPEFR